MANDMNMLSEFPTAVPAAIPQKKSGAKAAGVIGVAVVLAGGGAAAYAVSDTVKNQVKKTFASPADYFAWVCDKNTADTAELAGVAYQRAVSRTSAAEDASVSMIYTLSDDVKSMLADSGYVSGSPDEGLAKVLTETNSIGIIAQSNGNQGRVVLQRNEEGLVTLEGAVDTDASAIYARIPELTQRWLKIKYESLDYVAADSSQKLLDFAQHPEQYLTAQEVQEIIIGAGEVFRDNIKNVEEEKNVPVSVEGIETKYTELTATLSPDEVKALGAAFVDYVKGQPIIRSLVIDKLEVMSADEFDSECDRVRDELDTDQTVIIKLDVDAAGTVRGLRYSLDENFINFITVMDGDQFAAVIESDAAEGSASAAQKITVVGTKNGDVFNGTADITMNGGSAENMKLTFTDLKVVDEKRGYMDGTISMQGAGMDCTLKLTSDGGSQTIAYDDIMVGGKNVGSVKLNISEKGEKLEAPDTNGAFEMSLDNGGREIMEYVSEDEIRQFVINLLEKVGMSEQDAQAWGMML